VLDTDSAGCDVDVDDDVGAAEDEVDVAIAVLDEVEGVVTSCVVTPASPL
jgi:hypothetical protein